MTLLIRNPYQICNFCVMDTTDFEIQFDESGQCNHCKKASELSSLIIKTNSFDNLIQKIKNQRNAEGKYDGILGLSGGVDSSFLLVKLVEAGLFPLVVHVDAGWNTPESTQNIYKIVTKLNLELETVVVDWAKMRRMQIAYLESGIMNQDVPQDHAFFSSLYEIALKNKIKNVFVGSNYATESILPKSWAEDALDKKQIESVLNKYDKSLKLDFRLLSPFWFFWQARIIRNLRIHAPLNHLEYSRKNAIHYLCTNYDWQDYGGKHRESKFTTYYQEIYLKKRYGIDKRRAHLSSLIVNKEITRKEALDILSQPTFNEFQITNMRKYVANKLEISETQLTSFESKSNNSHSIKSSFFQKLIIRIITKIYIVIKK